VAMSGGVDSSTAALLLTEQGYEVIGVMMRLWAESAADGPSEHNRCCSPEAVEDARQVADQLDIPFYLVNYVRPFKEQVVDYFIQEYARSRTPNPCLMCNRHIKFGRLLAQARALGANYLATGHYARIHHAKGHFQLLRGRDAQKDQSYALYMLGQMELAHATFPVGKYTKEQVRTLAAERDLAVADRAESQDLCFLADGDYRRFLRERAPQALRPGPIVDRSGRVLGEHEGLALYTIGQRRGLGISAPQPHYVLDLDPSRNVVVIGTADELGQRELLAEEVSYVAGKPPPKPLDVTAKIRYQAREAPARWIPLGNGQARVIFDYPQRDITPGQGVVAYRGEVLIGGGIIV
jgi:tRNA-specific 2-thiouridylase